MNRAEKAIVLHKESTGLTILTCMLVLAGGGCMETGILKTINKTDLSRQQSLEPSVNRTPQQQQMQKSQMPEQIITSIPSASVGQNGIAVGIVSPNKARYKQGAPVAIVVAGGHGPAGPTGQMDLVECGFIEVHFGFPTGKYYDYRGPNCVLALRDVILFVMGRTTDLKGRKFQDIAGNIKVLTSNVGLIGESHGGNTCGAVMGLHGNNFRNLAFYVSIESPYGEGAAGVELGAREDGLNPAYDPQTGTLDLSKLAFDPNLPGHSFELAEEDELKGSLFFDMDGDATYNPDADFIARMLAFDLGRERKCFWSTRLITEAKRRNLFPKNRPAHIPTLHETIEFWRCRDATGLIPAAVRNIPNIAVIVVASKNDHVQIAPDHPHIYIQVNAFKKASASFIRLNPDRAYTQSFLDEERTSLVDNDAGLEYGPGNIQPALAPNDMTDAMMQAAACELADRTRTGNFEPNLDDILFPPTP